MSTAEILVANPFAALLHPASVLEACAKSSQLASLSSQVFRPLDNPMLAHSPEQAAYDAEIDGTVASSRSTTEVEAPATWVRDVPAHHAAPIITSGSPLAA